MAKYVDKTIDIKNEAVEKANEVIEVTQKDNF